LAQQEPASSAASSQAAIQTSPSAPQPKLEESAPPAQAESEKKSEEEPATPSAAKANMTPKQEAWQILESAYHGNKTGNRAISIRVMGLMPNDPKARRLAEGALGDEKPEVRAAAASALGEMKSRISIERLEVLLDDKDPGVALAAAHSLDLMHKDSAYEVYYEILTGQRKASKGLLASQTSILKDKKKLALLGFQEGIGFIPFAGIGWEGGSSKGAGKRSGPGIGESLKRRRRGQKLAGACRGARSACQTRRSSRARHG
jgi:hypothetical protein